jgi:hypothetical protein
MTLAQKVAEYGPEIEDAQIVIELNAPDPALPLKRVDVSTADAREVLLQTEEWSTVVMTAESAAALMQVRGAAITLRDTIELTTLIRATVPTIYAATETLLSGLVAAGVLTANTKDALLSLANKPQSWAEMNGIEVTARTVALARGAR